MQLEQIGRIQTLMNINDFINSINETIEDKLKNIVEHVGAQFQSEKNAESDEKNIEQWKIKISESFTASQQLHLYKKQQNKSDSDFLILLNKYEQQIQNRRMKER